MSKVSLRSRTCGAMSKDRPNNHVAQVPADEVQGAPVADRASRAAGATARRFPGVSAPLLSDGVGQERHGQTGIASEEGGSPDRSRTVAVAYRVQCLIEFGR